MAHILQLTRRRPDGGLFGWDEDRDGDNYRETLQCAHCGMHWIVERGSGRKRGFCHNCLKATCGTKRSCMTDCVPHEQQLERMESRGAELQRLAVELAERIYAASVTDANIRAIRH